MCAVQIAPRRAANDTLDTAKIYAKTPPPMGCWRAHQALAGCAVASISSIQVKVRQAAPMRSCGDIYVYGLPEVRRRA